MILRKPNRSSARRIRAPFSTVGSTKTSRSSVSRASMWNARAWAPIRRNFVFSERRALKNSRQSRGIVVIAEIESSEIFDGVESVLWGRGHDVGLICGVGVVERRETKNVLDGRRHDTTLSRSHWTGLRPARMAAPRRLRRPAVRVPPLPRIRRASSVGYPSPRPARRPRAGSEALGGVSEQARGRARDR